MDTSTPSTLYGPGARALQDSFDSRRLADRLSELTLHDELTEDDSKLVAEQSSFYLSTVDADGWPDVSYKGGEVGVMNVVDSRTLRFPSFDGNGMFRSLGNIMDNGRVALLFVDSSRPWRMRVHGSATVLTDVAIVDQFPGAQAVVEIAVGRIFPNCGRYVHAPDGAISIYVPTSEHQPPDPEWKELPMLKDYLPGHSP